MLGEMKDPAVRTWTGSSGSSRSSTSGEAHDDFDIVLKALRPESFFPSASAVDSVRVSPSSSSVTRRSAAASEVDSAASASCTAKRGSAALSAGGGEAVPGRLDTLFQTIATGTVIPSPCRASQGGHAQDEVAGDALATLRHTATGADSPKTGSVGADTPPTKRRARKGFAAVFGRGKNKCARH